MTANASSPKSQRINLRASAHQEALLRRAAEAEETSLTEFILSSAVAQAERVLADRRWFAVSDQQYEEFLVALGQPISTEKLAALFARESVFDKPFSLDD